MGEERALVVADRTQTLLNCPRGDATAELRLDDPEPRVEPRRLPPVAPERIRDSWRGGDGRPGRFHSSSHLAKSSVRGALVRLSAGVPRVEPWESSSQKTATSPGS
jgi:hypothetical protein